MFHTKESREKTVAKIKEYSKKQHAKMMEQHEKRHAEKEKYKELYKQELAKQRAKLQSQRESDIETYKTESTIRKAHAKASRKVKPFTPMTMFKISSKRLTSEQKTALKKAGVYVGKTTVELGKKGLKIMDKLFADTPKKRSPKRKTYKKKTTKRKSYKKKSYKKKSYKKKTYKKKTRKTSKRRGKTYYCRKCKARHSYSSKIGRKHR